MRFCGKLAGGSPVTYSDLEKMGLFLSKGRIPKDFVARREDGHGWKTVGAWLDEVAQNPLRPEPGAGLLSDPVALRVVSGGSPRGTPAQNLQSGHEGRSALTPRWQEDNAQEIIRQ